MKELNFIIYLVQDLISKYRTHNDWGEMKSLLTTSRLETDTAQVRPPKPISRVHRCQLLT